jgi:hypothetical protein
MRKLIILIPLLLCFTLCAPCVVGSTEPVDLTGRISVVGHIPHVKTALHTPGPKTYLIAGRWLAELNNLRGATVKVKGQITNTETLYKLPLIDIAEYQILTVDNGLENKKPWVGTLNGDTKLYLTTNSGKTFELDGPLAATLDDQSGAKVWITGSARYSGFFTRKVITLDAFGIIRPVKNVVY